MKRVTVIFERDEDGWWVASAKEIAGCHTQGRSIGQARQRFIEALGLFVDHPEKVALSDDIKLPAAARRLVKASTDARADSDQRLIRAQESTRTAVERLTTEMAMSFRDVGEILGLSHQRVQQLVRSTAHSQPTTSTRRRAKAAAAR